MKEVSKQILLLNLQLRSDSCNKHNDSHASIQWQFLRADSRPHKIWGRDGAGGIKSCFKFSVCLWKDTERHFPALVGLYYLMQTSIWLPLWISNAQIAVISLRIREEKTPLGRLSQQARPQFWTVFAYIRKYPVNEQVVALNLEHAYFQV